MRKAEPHGYRGPPASRLLVACKTALERTYKYLNLLKLLSVDWHPAHRYRLPEASAEASDPTGAVAPDVSSGIRLTNENATIG
jgi:hypothetical protein